MGWTRIAAAVGASLLVASCKPSAPSLTPEHRAALADSVRELAARMAADVSARGYRGFPPAMDSAPDYSWAYNGLLPFTSYDSMAAWARAEDEPHAPEIFAWDTVRVSVLAPGVATVAGTYTETQTDSTGRSKAERGIFTAVALHRAGGWKFTAAHTSTQPPPPPPQPAARRR